MNLISAILLAIIFFFFLLRVIAKSLTDNVSIPKSAMTFNISAAASINDMIPNSSGDENFASMNKDIILASIENPLTKITEIVLESIQNVIMYLEK
jgi:hypothetical protein